MTTTTKNSVAYEILVVFGGSLKPTALRAANEKLDKEIEKLGKITHQATWETRPLAYKIAQETTGTYRIFVVTTDPAKIPEFENSLRLDSTVLRFLIVKTPKHYKFSDYKPEDLEHDYKKINRDLFNESTPSEAPVKKPRTTTKKPTTKAAEPAAPKPAKLSKEETDKKLDSILEDL